MTETLAMAISTLSIHSVILAYLRQLSYIWLNLNFVWAKLWTNFNSSPGVVHLFDEAIILLPKSHFWSVLGAGLFLYSWFPAVQDPLLFPLNLAPYCETPTSPLMSARVSDSRPAKLEGGSSVHPPLPNFNQAQFPHFISVSSSQTSNRLSYGASFIEVIELEELVLGDTPTSFQNQFSACTLSAEATRSDKFRSGRQKAWKIAHGDSFLIQSHLLFCRR